MGNLLGVGNRLLLLASHVEADRRGVAEIFSTLASPHDIFTTVLPLLAVAVVAIKPSLQTEMCCSMFCGSLGRAHSPAACVRVGRSVRVCGNEDDNLAAFSSTKPPECFYLEVSVGNSSYTW